jgi:5-hydroxyisourate hydrolase
MSDSARTVVSTHVLDLVSGNPAPAIQVRLLDAAGVVLGSARTNADGRIEEWGGVADFAPGCYRLTFNVAAYRGGQDAAGDGVFFPQIDIVFCLDGTRSRVHVPVLLSTYGYTTYRGS